MESGRSSEWSERLSDLTFREVLDRARAGDSDARDELFSRLGREGAEGILLLALARRLIPRRDRLRSVVETQDVVQSALKSAWLRLEEFRGSTPEEFLNWIRTILRRKVGKVIRRMQDRWKRGEAGTRQDLQRQESSELPLDRLIREEVRARLTDAIGSLPEGQRTVLELRREGLNSREIAVRLGLDPQTVRKRESRAVARLRGLLELYGLE